MNYEEILESLSKKIKKNYNEIGMNLVEVYESKDGNYNLGKNNTIPVSHIFSWMESFFTGMAYWSYKFDGDVDTLKWLNSVYELYRKKIFDNPMDTMHDLGFLYSLYAVAIYKLTGDEKMKELGVKAADELSKRFNPKGGYIRAWGRMDDTIPDYIDESIRTDTFFADSKGRAIIDSMMNIPLLFWASEVTGHPFYKRVATCTADTIINYFVREDYSVCHSYMFDPETGEPLREEYNCGYSIGSHWARGTAWAVYGFAIAYSYTSDRKYLEVSEKLLEKFIDECDGEMPIWDFRLPTSEPQNIDTSAVAIVLCAINEISEHIDNKKIRKFEVDFADKLLRYIDFDINKHGILKEQNGRNVYGCYGDYFVVEYFASKTMKSERIW